MPEAKRKERKHRYEVQAESHLNGLRVTHNRPQKPGSTEENLAGEQRQGEAIQPDQPALVSKLIEFIKTM